jgi:hypothetical protein
MVTMYYLDSNENNSINFDENLSTSFPEEYKNLKDFSDACNEYIEVINSTQILKEFNKYLSLQDLGV